MSTTALLTESQREVQTLARDFAREEIAPHAAEWNARHHVPVEPARRVRPVPPWQAGRPLEPAPPESGVAAVASHG